jgi:hypothetical protein
MRVKRDEPARVYSPVLSQLGEILLCEQNGNAMQRE